MMELSPDGERLDAPRPMIDLDALIAERDRTLARQVRVKPPLTRLIPIPRPVALAEEMVVVGEVTLGDVATLQAFMESASPSPLAEEDSADAWHASTSWPPRFGMPEGSRILATPAGRAEVLRVALRQDPLTPQQLGELVAWATAEEWRAFERVAYGVTPRMELVARHDPADDTPAETDWEKRIAWLLKEVGGDFERVARMTLTQARFVLSAGKLPESTREFQARSIRASRVLRGG